MIPEGHVDEENASPGEGVGDHAADVGADDAADLEDRHEEPNGGLTLFHEDVADNAGRRREEHAAAGGLYDAKDDQHVDGGREARADRAEGEQHHRI